MMEKLMRDSLESWRTNFHVDGFRFDLMNLHSVQVMGRIRDYLRAKDPSILLYGEAWNFGPGDNGNQPVEWVTQQLCALWGNGASYQVDTHPQPHEATFLKLDCSKAKTRLGWSPRWDLGTALSSVVDWYKEWISGNNIRNFTESQIDFYLNS